MSDEQIERLPSAAVTFTCVPDKKNPQVRTFAATMNLGNLVVDFKLTADDFALLGDDHGWTVYPKRITLTKHYQLSKGARPASAVAKGHPDQYYMVEIVLTKRRKTSTAFLRDAQVMYVRNRQERDDAFVLKEVTTNPAAAVNKPPVVLV